MLKDPREEGKLSRQQTLTEKLDDALFQDKLASINEEQVDEFLNLGSEGRIASKGLATKKQETEEKRGTSDAGEEQQTVLVQGRFKVKYENSKTPSPNTSVQKIGKKMMTETPKDS